MLLTEERLRKVTLLRLEISHIRYQVSQIRSLGDLVIDCLLRFDTSGFKPLIADIASLLPEGHDVLRGLLFIPDYANLVNQLMERSTHPGFSGLSAEAEAALQANRKANILRNLSTLDEQCQGCQARLQSIFGPGVDPETRSWRDPTLVPRAPTIL
jgi:hypothetical protein